MGRKLLSRSRTALLIALLVSFVALVIGPAAAVPVAAQPTVVAPVYEVLAQQPPVYHAWGFRQWGDDFYRIYPIPPYRAGIQRWGFRQWGDDFYRIYPIPH